MGVIGDEITAQSDEDKLISHTYMFLNSGMPQYTIDVKERANDSASNHVNFKFFIGDEAFSDTDKFNLREHVGGRGFYWNASFKSWIISTSSGANLAKNTTAPIISLAPAMTTQMPKE